MANVKTGTEGAGEQGSKKRRDHSVASYKLPATGNKLSPDTWPLKPDTLRSAFAHGEPWHAPIGIRHHPRSGHERQGNDSFTPIGGIS